MEVWIDEPGENILCTEHALRKSGTETKGKIQLHTRTRKESIELHVERLGVSEIPALS